MVELSTHMQYFDLLRYQKKKKLLFNGCNWSVSSFSADWVKNHLTRWGSLVSQAGPERHKPSPVRVFGGKHFPIPEVLQLGSIRPLWLVPGSQPAASLAARWCWPRPSQQDCYVSWLRPRVWMPPIQQLCRCQMNNGRTRDWLALNYHQQLKLLQP